MNDCYCISVLFLSLFIAISRYWASLIEGWPGFRPESCGCWIWPLWFSNDDRPFAWRGCSWFHARSGKLAGQKWPFSLGSRSKVCGEWAKLWGPSFFSHAPSTMKGVFIWNEMLHMRFGLTVICILGRASQVASPSYSRWHLVMSTYVIHLEALLHLATSWQIEDFLFKFFLGPFSNFMTSLTLTKGRISPLGVGVDNHEWQVDLSPSSLSSRFRPLQWLTSKKCLISKCLRYLSFLAVNWWIHPHRLQHDNQTTRKDLFHQRGLWEHVGWSSQRICQNEKVSSQCKS